MSSQQQQIAALEAAAQASPLRQQLGEDTGSGSADLQAVMQV